MCVRDAGWQPECGPHNIRLRKLTRRGRHEIGHRTVRVGQRRAARRNGGREASLTGHLVLSTLHTNSAPESVTRLLGGYKGRIGVHELLIATPQLRRLVQLRSPAAEIARCAVCA